MTLGEYLTARRIVQEVQYIHRKLEDRYNDSYEDWTGFASMGISLWPFGNG